MTLLQRLEAFIIKTFKTTVEIFLEALNMSPNAQGYVSGELLLKTDLVWINYLTHCFPKKKTC